MKYLFLLAATSFGLFAPKFSQKISLEGTVQDVATKEKLIGASVIVFQNNERVAGGVSNVDGQYQLEVAPGEYTVECRYTGYETQRITEVKIEQGKITKLDFALKSAALNEILTTSFAVKRRGGDGGKYGDVSLMRSSTMPAGATMSAKPSAPAAAESAPVERVMYESRGAVIGDFAAKKSDASREKRRPMDPVAPPAHDDKMVHDPMPDVRRSQPTPRAGLLTGGEWNDLHNWQKHWLDLLADGEIAPHMDAYKFYPKQRFSVLLENENHFPAVDAEVQLLAKNGSPLWSARTDNTGRAELWAGLFDPKFVGKDLQLAVNFQGKTTPLGKAKTFADGLNQFTLKFDCAAPTAVDICWAVDATGSMGDEIEYLKTELLDVIGRVKKANPELAVRMGTVFYRDHGDEYITKSSGLSSEIEKTVGFIRQQFAGGGGDYPEAVDAALEEAVFRQDWSRAARTRICFLVLDASPHQEPAVLERLQKTVAEAARRGIRIVPLTASGIQKDTEFLMKFFGLATNGTYTFLTDHSGIGGKHLEPTTDEYKVEQLNDLLVRLITEYTTVKSCEGKSAIQFVDNQQQTGSPDLGWTATFYPNPANEQFTLDLPVNVQSLTIYNSEGQAVRKLTELAAGPTAVAVADLPPGFYTLRILKDGQWASGKLVVVRT